ncbi:MAG: hypothetical protein IM620_21165, partial [Cytophagales bacterium]|nr:hypothetical protein [Cytophagales bacterium]
MYVITGLHGGTPTALANLNISSNLVISSNTFISANLLVTGTANVTVNLNSVGIVSNNITVNNNITVTNTAVLNTATAVTANVTTANIVTLGVTGVTTTANINVTNNANLVSANITTANVTTLGVTGLSTFVNTTVGSGTSNVQANTTQITISNPSAVATVNATTFTGTAANATLLNNQNGAFYTNATNITTGTLPWNQAPTNTVNTTGAFTFTGIHTYNVNAIVNTATLTVGNASVNVVSNTTTLAVSNSTSSVTVNSGIIFVGNASANVTVNSSVFSGTANNSLALGGFIANTSSPSDGFVLAFNQSENRIKWVNPSGISTALTSNSVVANASLQAGSNGSTYVLTAEGNTISTNLVMRANNISLTVDSGNIRLNSNTLVSDRLLAGNTDANVTIVTSTITIQNSSSVATLTPNSFSRQANGATHLGPEGSGVNLSTLQGQITGNASTAYTNATNFASNATNITTGTLTGSVLPASVVNTSGNFAISGILTYNANLFMNTANQLLIGNNSVNAVANQTTIAIFNATTNTSITPGTITFGGGATVNNTIYSGTANNASNFGGVTLGTLQGQFTSNDATTYSNATAFASNATNITTGTLAAARLPATIVNTSASFTLAGGMTFDGTVRFNANVGINRVPGTDNSRFNVLFPTTVNATDVLYIQKTRDSANAARYGFTDVGGLTTDSNGGAFWRGFHLAAPGITDGAAVSTFPRFVVAAETETLTNPSTRRWLLEAGNDSATSRYSIVMRTAGADRFIIASNGHVGIGTSSPFSIFHALSSGTGASVATTGTTDATTIGRFGRGSVGIDIGVVDAGPAYIQARNVGDFSSKFSLFLNPTGGNVGIGVSDPIHNLDVNGVIRSRNEFSFVARRSASWGWSTLTSGGSAATSGYFASYNPADARIGYMGYWDGTNFVGAATDSTTSMLFNTNGTTRLTFDGSTGQATFANKVLINGAFEWNGSASGICEIKPPNLPGTTASSVNTLQIFQSTTGQDAFMTFHVNSDFAFHFGLDTTTNDLFVGGWSFGAVKYRVWHEGNDSTLAAKTQTLTNKRINPRVSSAASGDISPDISAADMYIRTALAAAATINSPTGTPVSGNRLMFRLKDNGTARGLTWTSGANGFRAVGITLPTTTVVNKTTYVGCIWNADDSRWDAIAVSTEA